MNGQGSAGGVTRQVFEDPIVQLAALCPLCALAALSPAAALSALSPVLRHFNPATNPFAALLAFSRDQAKTQFVIAARIGNTRARLGAKIANLSRRTKLRQFTSL